VIGPWEMVYPIVNFRIWIPRALGTELEDGPIFPVFTIKERDKLIGRVSVGFLGPR